MSGFLRESKFRNIVPAVSKRDAWYEQLKVADSSSTDGNGLTSNSCYIAYADSGGGRIEMCIIYTCLYHIL